jgi:hypothetical protein
MQIGSRSLTSASACYYISIKICLPFVGDGILHHLSNKLKCPVRAPVQEEAGAAHPGLTVILHLFKESRILTTVPKLPITKWPASKTLIV